jgi:hypothetical protein
MPSASTDGNDLTRVSEIDSVYEDLDTQHDRLERQANIVAQHRVETRALLGFIVGIGDGIFDQPVQADLPSCPAVTPAV